MTKTVAPAAKPTADSTCPPLVNDSSKSSNASAAVSAPAANPRSEARKWTGGIHRIPVNAPATKAPEVTSAKSAA